MELVTIIATVAAAASSLFAGIGLIFAGQQLRIVRRQHDVERRVAYDGVAVSWFPIEAPAQPNPDGTAVWLYQIAVQNPGKLPIQNVSVHVTFPAEVVRIRYDGSRGKPVRTLTMNHPVLGGGESRAWRRRLRIAFADRERLTGTYARVSFQDVDGRRYRNDWPRWQDDVEEVADDPGAANVGPPPVSSHPPEPPASGEKPGAIRDDDTGRPADKRYNYDADEATESVSVRRLGEMLE